jgi:hypothetical protein
MKALTARKSLKEKSLKFNHSDLKRKLDFNKEPIQPQISELLPPIKDNQLLNDNKTRVPEIYYKEKAENHNLIKSFEMYEKQMIKDYKRNTQYD